jgi:DNA-binding NarL/FixJ family response regulator
MMIRIAIVDDNRSLAKSLKKDLSSYAEIDSIVIAASGEQFIHSLTVGEIEQPQVALMDISMNHASEGIETTKMLHILYPETKVVMFTVSENDDLIFEAFKAGAVGYILKNEQPEFIINTIREVYLGGAFMSPGIALKAIRFLAQQTPPDLKSVLNSFQLSEREMDVLREVARGFPYKLIADELMISQETVKKHMTNIFTKLQVKNKIEALNKMKEFL